MRTVLTPALLAAASLGVVGLLAPAASAQVIDGSVDASYGPALFVQDTPTGFGDNTNPDPLVAGGSEIDGVFANVSGGNLNLLVTGNVETNFNRLVLFVNSVAGGDNVVGTTTTASAGSLNDFNGLTFDTGFGADFFLVVNGGNNPNVEFFADFAQIGTSGSFIGQTTAGSQTATFSNGIQFGVDNSNVAGVTAGDAPVPSVAGAGAVTTGLEFAIPLSVIGNPTGPIQVAGFISGGNFLSNQVIGGVGGAGNLGNNPLPDFSQIAGDQFVTVPNDIPEPTSLAAIGLGSLALLRRRR